MQGANYKVFSSDNKLVSLLKYYWQYISEGYRFYDFRETLGKLKDYGPDFVNFIHLLEKCGKSKVDVKKSTDDSFHVDYESDLSLLKGFLPFSVVVTMSLNETGTQIADYGRDFFTFDDGWDFDETKIQEEKILIVQDGDIVFMRANDSSYLAPCIHRAPPREYNRTKDRIVGIAELLPY